jgi:hypothetical protein
MKAYLCSHSEHHGHNKRTSHVRPAGQTALVVDLREDDLASEPIIPDSHIVLEILWQLIQSFADTA